MRSRGKEKSRDRCAVTENVQAPKPSKGWRQVLPEEKALEAMIWYFEK